MADYIPPQAHKPLYGNEGPHGETARRPLQEGEIERRIEMIRQLIIYNVSREDIKRECVKVWSKENRKFGRPDYKPRSIEKYYTRAMQRNMGAIDSTADENLAASLGLWGKLQRDAMKSIELESRALATAEKTYAESEARIQAIEDLPADDRKAAKEQLEILEMRKSNAIQRIVDAKRTLTQNKQEVKECQREIDRLKGTHAPIKHATTKADGTDVERMTEAEIEEALLRMGYRMPPKLLTGEAAAVEQIISDEPVIDAEFEPAAKVKPSKNGHAQNGHATNGHANGNGHSPHVPPFVSSILNGHTTNGHAPAPAKEVDNGEQNSLTLDDFFDI